MVVVTMAMASTNPQESVLEGFGLEGLTPQPEVLGTIEEIVGEDLIAALDAVEVVPEGELAEVTV